MDDLNFYIQESSKALEIINENLEHTISDVELQSILASKLGYSEKDHSKILTHKLEEQQIIDIYKASGFEKLDEIVTFETFLPKGTPGRLDEKRVKVKGEIWCVHKSDDDQFPSNPHAHNIQTGYKLHLGNGKLFNRNKKLMKNKVSKKHLILIRNQLDKFKLPKWEF